MVDWTTVTSDASVSERDAAFVPLRVPGPPDVFKEYPANLLAKSDASGNILLPNAFYLSARDVADTTYLPLIGRNTGDEVVIDISGYGTKIGAGGAVNIVSAGDVGIGSTPLLKCDVAGSVGSRSTGVASYGTQGSAYLSGAVIASFSGQLVFGTDGTGWKFAISKRVGGTVTQLWAFTDDSNLSPESDAAANFGKASQRINNSYFAVSPTVTSDEREKMWRGALTDIEYAAGLKIIAKMGFYQWNNEVENKGPNKARFHFGARAQQVWAICAEHSMAPKIRKNGTPENGIIPPAFLCFDEWTEETEPEFQEAEVEYDEQMSVPTGQTVDVDGKTLELNEVITRKATRIEAKATGKTVVRTRAGNRYGLRVDQLNSFLISVQARRQDELDARITALESVVT